MSIFNALSVGISGLAAVDNQFNILSDNIANTDTTGYKQGTTDFESLLNQTITSTYTPGGVESTLQQEVTGQGEVNNSSSPTDIAISGAGFFPVSAGTTGSDILYTRSGSFTQDQNGNFVNGAGFFLRGYRLDINGNLPAGLDTTNVDQGVATANLQVVNAQSITDVAVPTTELAIQANLNSSQAAFTPPSAYDPADPTKNMASGAVTPQFSRPITVVDNKGATHTLTAGFLKTDTNTWAVELYVQPASDVTEPNGQIASGTLTFNGDGTLASVSPSLSQPITAGWTNGGPAEISVNWGTAGQEFGTPGAVIIGKSDGMQQVDEDYTVQSFTQNGIQAGNLTGVTIDDSGNVVATYDSGHTRDLYKIPLAEFRAPDQLNSETGNVFSPTADAGPANFILSGTTEAGSIKAGALEASNVDLASQLTTIVLAQRAYQANTKTITTADTMLQDLDEMLT